VLGVDPVLLSQGRRSKAISEAKAITSYFAVRIFLYSGEAVGRFFGESRSGVIRGAVRGEEIVRADPARWDQIWARINNSATSL